MRYAIIPKSSGDRVAAWFCTAGVGCRGCYGQRIMSNMVGSPEDAAIAHAKQHGEEGVIHVVVAGRGHTYKVWMSASGLLSREIL